MKRALHYWALPQSVALKEKFRIAADCGFDGVELSILHEGDLTDVMHPDELDRIRLLAGEYGLELHSITSLLNWECSATSDRPEIRRRAVDALKTQIDTASRLGATAILALPGFVALDFSVGSLCSSEQEGGPYSPTMERIDYDKAFSRSIECFSQIAPYAERAGVVVCIENIWSHFLLSPLEMRTLVDTVGSPFVKAYFDIANVMPHGFADQWIRILGERIGRVHFKDYILSAHSLDGFTELLKGDVDFKAVMAALRQIGYDGWVTAELTAPIDDRGDTARRTAEAMDRILGGV